MSSTSNDKLTPFAQFANEALEVMTSRMSARLSYDLHNIGSDGTSFEDYYIEYKKIDWSKVPVDPGCEYCGCDGSCCSD